MGNVRPALKDELTRREKWREFCHARDEYKRESGCTPLEARTEALKKLGLDDLLPLVSDTSKRGGRPSKRIAEAKAKIEAKEVEKTVEVAPVSDKALKDAILKDLMKRKAPWGEVIDWVVANAYMPEENIDYWSCPDMKAYTYLQACRGSALFLSDFLLKMGQARMPKKVEEVEKNDGDNFDGKEEYDLLGVIQETIQE